jgi:hypothetical protein
MTRNDEGNDQIQVGESRIEEAATRSRRRQSDRGVDDRIEVVVARLRRQRPDPVDWGASSLEIGVTDGKVVVLACQPAYASADHKWNEQVREWPREKRSDRVSAKRKIERNERVER